MTMLCGWGFCTELWDRSDNDNALWMGLFETLQAWSTFTVAWKTAGLHIYRGCIAPNFQGYSGVDRGGDNFCYSVINPAILINVQQFFFLKKYFLDCCYFYGGKDLRRSSFHYYGSPSFILLYIRLYETQFMVAWMCVWMCIF